SGHCRPRRPAACMRSGPRRPARRVPFPVPPTTCAFAYFVLLFQRAPSLPFRTPKKQWKSRFAGHRRAPTCSPPRAWGMIAARSSTFGKGSPMFLLPSCRRRQFAAFSLLAAVSLIAAGCDNRDFSPESPTTTAAGSAAQRDFLFCFWNVENFFDDQDDHRTAAGDKEYDGLYANRPDLLQLKIAQLTQALLKMNGGKGPDIVALSEVESVRAAEL